MSVTERRLPQYCRYKCRAESFDPSRGKFVDNNSFFVCFGCLNRLRRWHARRAAYEVSDAEAEMMQELHRCGKKFERSFRLGKWEFDYAFPGERVLLELDGRSHDYPRRKALDSMKEEAAVAEGWRVVRVKYGPGLLRRVAAALAGGQPNVSPSPENH
jgi:very-short-patch-repair endonuclease